MKKLILFFCGLAFTATVTAQTKPGPVEKKMMDSLCIALSKLDMSKISTKEEAKAAFMDCFTRYTGLFMDFAKERNVSIDDEQAGEVLGKDLAKDLLEEKCDGFLKLSMKMAGKDNEEDEVSDATGVFKRIDNKGFNYFIIAAQGNKEQSFIWLRQFPGSENYMQGVTKLAGKKIKIKYREIEVYLPTAQGYYKVKEVVALEIL
jgi:hypothetical protein